MKKNIMLMLAMVFSLPILGRAEGLLIYQPPKIGAPTSRIGGGTRGLILPKLKALAPSDTALTSQAQPTLYWYLFEQAPNSVKLRLFNEGDDEPIFEKQLPPATSAGIQTIRLADYGVFLLTGRNYRWSLTLADDTGTCFGACTTRATLRYELYGNPGASLEDKAQAGYWYDVTEQLIESHAPNVNDWLKQVDIDIPAI